MRKPYPLHVLTWYGKFTYWRTTTGRVTPAACASITVRKPMARHVSSEYDLATKHEVREGLSHLSGHILSLTTNTEQTLARIEADLVAALDVRTRNLTDASAANATMLVRELLAFDARLAALERRTFPARVWAVRRRLSRLWWRWRLRNVRDDGPDDADDRVAV